MYRDRYSRALIKYKTKKMFNLVIIFDTELKLLFLEIKYVLERKKLFSYQIFLKYTF